jgi:hypothetical protein
MKNLAIIFALLFSCGPARTASPASAPSAPRGVGLCEIMAAPEKFAGRHVELRSDALVLDAGILLKSAECKSVDVPLHYIHGYEKNSDAEAVRILSEIERQVRKAASVRPSASAAQRLVGLTVEGKLESNPYYRLKIARGDRTLMSWDYSYRYAFVVSRVAHAGERAGR